jgi:ABC-2 type transport system permease protein
MKVNKSAAAVAAIQLPNKPTSTAPANTPAQAPAQAPANTPAQAPAQAPANAPANALAQAPSIATDYVYGSSETTFFDVLSPVLVGFFVFFFVFLISGIGLLRERTTGTLERLMSTPIRRSEVITGYLAGYGIFAILQTIIVVLYAVNVLDITLAGSIWNVLLINLLLAFVALSLGILLSTFAASEFQMVQFIPLVVIPQIFFAGIFPIEGLADWLQALSKIMPIYYGADALKGVMYRGETFSDVSDDLLALLVFAAVFIILNTLALKKYRRL